HHMKAFVQMGMFRFAATVDAVAKVDTEGLTLWHGHVRIVQHGAASIAHESVLDEEKRGARGEFRHGETERFLEPLALPFGGVLDAVDLLGERLDGHANPLLSWVVYTIQKLREGRRILAVDEAAHDPSSAEHALLFVIED